MYLTDIHLMFSYTDQNPHKLAVGSAIQYGDPPKYGVIKWLGKFPQGERMYGGIEMVSVDDICKFCSSFKLL